MRHTVVLFRQDHGRDSAPRVLRELGFSKHVLAPFYSTLHREVEI